MRIRWGRLLLGTTIAELVPIATLALMVAAMDPRNPREAQMFAHALGRWAGPFVGAGMAFVMAGWVSRPLRAGHALHGFLLGLLLAIVDVFLLVMAGETVVWIFAVSNLGKIAAGTIGGMMMAPPTARAR